MMQMLSHVYIKYRRIYILYICTNVFFCIYMRKHLHHICILYIYIHVCMYSALLGRKIRVV